MGGLNAYFKIETREGKNSLYMNRKNKHDDSKFYWHKLGGP
jgi:hypothetical protein